MITNQIDHKRELLKFLKELGFYHADLEVYLNQGYFISGMAATLKEMYSDLCYTNLCYTNNPFLSMVPKDDKFGGAYVPVPIEYGEGETMNKLELIDEILKIRLSFITNQKIT